MTHAPIPSEVFGKAWALMPEVIKALALTGSFAPSDPHASHARMRSLARGQAAIIPIRGVISHRATLEQRMFGSGTSIEKLTGQFRSALHDRSVSAIVFDIDSPGGEVEGLLELADEVLDSRPAKRIVAVANGEACSGAYWLAASAEELSVTPSGLLGGIGVYMLHSDVSEGLRKEGVRVSLISAGRYKVEQSPFAPLSPDARRHMQSTVDSIHDKFLRTVARGRRVSVASVRRGFGEGRSVVSHAAVAQRMADRVETLDELIARLRSGPARQGEAALNTRRLDLRRRELDLH